MSAASRCPQFSDHGRTLYVEIQKGTLDCASAQAVFQYTLARPPRHGGFGPGNLGQEPDGWSCFRPDVITRGNEVGFCYRPANDLQNPTDALLLLDVNVPILCDHLTRARYSIDVEALHISCGLARAIARSYVPGCARSRSSRCTIGAFHCIRRLNTSSDPLSYSARCVAKSKVALIEFTPPPPLSLTIGQARTRVIYYEQHLQDIHVRHGHFCGDFHPPTSDFISVSDIWVFGVSCRAGRDLISQAIADGSVPDWHCSFTNGHTLRNPNVCVQGKRIVGWYGEAP